ncbi:sensor histidine kinase [Microbacterium sp. A196]|uniref:sensor histidine kinase n=1 Tax=unclassified Microbacterium TaxID=2609290 RepID=UPI003FD27F8B
MSASHHRRLPAMDLAVDIGFAILLVVCAVRYFGRHPLEGVGVAALVLAIGTAVSYAVAVIARRNPETARAASGLEALGSRQGVGLLLATAFWLPLTILAPSFGWCGFALFFAVHRVIRGRLAIAISTAIVVAVSVGLLLMSKGDDLGLVLGPFFGGLVLTYAYTALDRALDAQQVLIGELIDTRAQLAESERDAGAMAERERVASELHDTVVQSTASALLMLESDDLRGATGSPAVRKARESLRETLIETRQLLHGLADPRTSADSLAAVLEAQSLSAEASFSIVGYERVVPEAVSHALARIVQEALVNVRKHAHASSVHVTLTFFDSAVGIDVADDGIGFDTDAVGTETNEASSGFGIRAMTWRVENLGGTLTIETRPGEGTVVSAIVPSPAAEEGTT